MSTSLSQKYATLLNKMEASFGNPNVVHVQESHLEGDYSADSGTDSDAEEMVTMVHSNKSK